MEIDLLSTNFDFSLFLCLCVLISHVSDLLRAVKAGCTQYVTPSLVPQYTMVLFQEQRALNFGMMRLPRDLQASNIQTHTSESKPIVLVTYPTTSECQTQLHKVNQQYLHSAPQCCFFAHNFKICKQSERKVNSIFMTLDNCLIYFMTRSFPIRNMGSKAG